MQKIKLKRLLDLHAWFGVTTGLFIFIIAFSGVVALFGDEKKGVLLIIYSLIFLLKKALIIELI